MRHTRGALVTGVQKCALPICNKTAHEHRAGDRSNRSEAERQAHTKITKAPTKYKASARHLVRALDAKIQGGGRWARSNYGNKTADKHRAGGESIKHEGSRSAGAYQNRHRQSSNVATRLPQKRLQRSHATAAAATETANVQHTRHTSEKKNAERQR